MSLPFKNLETAESFKARCLEADAALKSARTAMGDAELKASLEPSPENNSAADKAFRAFREAELNVARSAARLDSFQTQKQNQLDREKNAKNKANIAKAGEISNQIITIGGELEDLATLIARKFSTIIELKRTAIPLVLKTDGTPIHDSLLADQAFVGYLKLELRRAGIESFHPWFKGDEKIPTMVKHLKEATGWLMKFADDETKAKGMWIGGGKSKDK